MHRHQQHRHCLGSEAHITIVSSADCTDTFASLWSWLEDFEQRFSRFRPDSELSHFNHHAGTWQQVSPEFSAMLDSCTTYATRTHGLFNPFILPTLQSLGYKGSWPTPTQHLASLDMSDRLLAPIHQLERDGQRAKIPHDTALDFGGIGKGYALDALAAQLQAATHTNFWLSLGGDIICRGLDSDNAPWNISIIDIHDTNRDIASCHADNSDTLLAVATSAVTQRRGADWHHIIDPRTERSSTSTVLSATVVAASGTEADIYAKCLVIDPAFRPNIHAHLLQYANSPPSITQTKEYLYAL